MFTSLPTIVRLGVLSFAGLSLAALTAEQLQSESAPTRLALRPNAWEAVNIETERGTNVLELLNREDGRMQRAVVPPSEHWEFVSTSPWSDENGSMEAIGRFSQVGFSCGRAVPDGPIGLIRVRMPEGRVIERVPLDVLPTGRPAWNPLRADQVVFPGSTGQLYSFRFTPEATASAGASNWEGAAVRPLTWACEPMGGRAPYLVDPSWPREPELKNLMIVSLAPFGRPVDGKPAPLTPWWLELDEDGEEIVAAGPLFGPDDPDAAGQMRSPIVTVRDGRPRLAFIQQKAPTGPPTAFLADLEWDPQTGRPRVRPGSTAPLPVALPSQGTLIPSLDAATAYLAPLGHMEGVRGVLRLPLEPAPLGELRIAAKPR